MQRACQSLAIGVCAAALLAGLGGCSDDGVTLPPGQERVLADEDAIGEQLVRAIRNITDQRTSDGIVRRFNQPKNLGCFAARFVVPEQPDPALAQGLFARPGSYHADIRFGSATKFDDREKDFRGMSIKVHDVPGETLWGKAGKQDFILNSYPALFAGTPGAFLSFVQAMEKGRTWMFFVHPAHWKSLLIVMRGRSEDHNPLALRYWSTTPYRFGAGSERAVKYSVRPCAPVPAPEQKDDHPDRLTRGMAAHLAGGAACFDFMVQFQGDPEAMPIEDASVIWDESVSPFHTVARIEIDNQRFDDDVSMAACERISFNPWQGLADHQPLGGINRVRRAVYEQTAAYRGANE